MDKPIRDARGLQRLGVETAGSDSALQQVIDRYALSITPTMTALIKDNPDGPVARQFIPTGAELVTTPDELGDPIADGPYTPVEGVTHRYPDRVLLKPVHVCPVYCRFCFRREMVGPGQTASLSSNALETALDYIRRNSQIWEVIFTGGDPLIMSPSKLAPIVAALDAIPHVKTIRFHTRVPIVDPEKVTDDLLDALDVDTPVWVAIHTNHADEFTASARAALRRLSRRGIPLISQTVLLRGINDDAQTLEELLRTLVANRVKPYYLHQGDLANGTSHFRTSIAEGQRLMADLRGNLSGLAQPTYVLDIPGGYGKVPIGPVYAAQTTDTTYDIEDPYGKTHQYPPKASHA